MKTATSDTRIRIEISLDGVHKAEPITMTAGQWNGISVALSEAAKRMESMGCNAIAKPYKKAAHRISMVLAAKRYYGIEESKAMLNALKQTDPELFKEGERK